MANSVTYLLESIFSCRRSSSWSSSLLWFLRSPTRPWRSVHDEDIITDSQLQASTKQHEITSHLNIVHTNSNHTLNNSKYHLLIASFMVSELQKPKVQVQKADTLLQHETTTFQSGFFFFFCGSQSCEGSSSAPTVQDGVMHLFFMPQSVKVICCSLQVKCRYQHQVQVSKNMSVNTSLYKSCIPFL